MLFLKIKKKKKRQKTLRLNHEYFYQLSKLLHPKVNDVYTPFSCAYLYFLLHLYSNLDFDWHINDKNYFTVLNDKKVKYTFWNNIIESTNENLHFVAHSGE